MSDLYQLWRLEAPRHCDLTFVLFHRHNEGGTCSLSSIFKDVGTVMTLSEGYYTNQRVLRETHVMHITDYTSPALCAFVGQVLIAKKKLTVILFFLTLCKNCQKHVTSSSEEHKFRIQKSHGKHFTFKSSVFYLLGAIMSVSYKHAFRFSCCSLKMLY